MLEALMDDPLDQEIDLGATRAEAVEAEQSERRWPLVAMFLLFAVVAALSVGFFLRSSTPAPIAEKKAVAETIVDLPSDAPIAPVAPVAPDAPDAPVAPDAPAAPIAPIAPIAPLTGRV